MWTGTVKRKYTGRDITSLSSQPSFSKSSAWKVFPSTLKRKTSVFKFHRLEERFWKASFLWRISVDGRRLTVEIKLRFSIFCGVVWTGPKLSPACHFRHYLLTFFLDEACFCNSSSSTVSALPSSGIVSLASSCVFWFFFSSSSLKNFFRCTFFFTDAFPEVELLVASLPLPWIVVFPWSTGSALVIWVPLEAAGKETNSSSCEFCDNGFQISTKRSSGSSTLIFSCFQLMNKLDEIALFWKCIDI